ncbi:MAG: hypothetical protein PGN24_11990 [Microbacterium arborescens]
MTTSRFAAAAAALLLTTGLALAGCATTPGQGGAVPESAAPESAAPDTAEPAPMQNGEPAAAWLDGGRAVGLVTFGSSSCQPVVGEATASGQTVSVGLSDPEGTPCTRDLVPRASYVPLPAGVDPSADVEIEITGEYAATVSLAGASGLSADEAADAVGDMEPGAGRFGDGGIVLLTYGSSSCPPVFESVGLDSTDRVRAVEAAAPADQVCTMDYAPRLSVLQLAGGAGGATPGELVIVSPTGDEQSVVLLG